MKTAIYEPRYLEYPGVSLPEAFARSSSSYDDLSSLYDLPSATTTKEQEETPFTLPDLDYTLNPFKGNRSSADVAAVEVPTAKSVKPATNLKGTDEKAIYLMKRLQSELNLTKEQAAGVAGNIHVESQGFNPRAVGDGGAALGLAQWHPDRRRGLDILNMSYEDQVSYLIKELQTEKTFNARGGLNKLRQLKTASEAAAFIDKNYERSSGEHRRQRQSYAEAYAKLKFLRGGRL